MTAAEVIRDAREKAGLTQAEFAARVGVTQSVVSAYERGRREPSFRTLVDFISLAGSELSISVDYKPTPTLAYVRSKKAELEAALGQLGAEDIRVFGSVARGDASPGSDVDLLVHLRTGVSLFDLSGMHIDAGEILGMPVDVVPDTGLKSYAKDNILAEAVPL
ncbi:helix-turn-helix domain-containing protein [Microbacterium suaedae]|uniref:helix-turn-helix domain-containing protein n=1 Tax=Microbacterium suaedae TaxID=2067813 RepID=UPI000DA20967|nr:helix-turn-helix domain-containing protein [Microbacterium suaedae]